jgi:alkylation response protein AidB-like acyl-CoA dehydrogenase
MDFDDTPAEAAFRAEARAWLDANAPKHLEPELRRATVASKGVTSEDPLAAARCWQKQKAAAGYACLHWPKAYGGGGCSPIQRVIWQQEEGVYGLLSLIFAIGHGMCGPTLMAWASEAQKAARLPPLITGEEIWCQLFSEPAAGSDLASLRTRAEPTRFSDGDWRINGQKIWTSNAHISDWGLLLARTDPAAPKHKGLTMFFLDMRSPGIEVRPIRQANGDAGFSEVFFTDVRVPDAQRLGQVGEGWKVSLTTLMNERASIGARLATGFPEVFDLCRRLETGDGPAIEDRAVRARLAAWAARDSGLKYTAMRAISALSRGEVPGPENSIGKLVAGQMMQEIAAFALELQGQAGALAGRDLAPDAGRFQAMLLRAPATRIAGGTDEIMRNIIAERVLGLPPDIRVDKDVPFNQIPTGGRS